MLAKRILTAAILLPCVLAIIFWTPSAWFAACAAAIFLGAQWEWQNLCLPDKPYINLAALALTVLIMLGLWFARDTAGVFVASMLIGVVFWLSVLLWLRRPAFAASPTHAHTALKLGAGYLVILPAWMALVHMRDSEWGPGQALVLFVLCIVWAADIGAYFCGRAFGKTKLAPSISPGKTRAGAWGGIISSLLATAIGGWSFSIDYRLFAPLLLVGLATVCAAIAGDLFESLIKRHANAKDSSQLLPGHGGLLDRLDSVFAALPIFAAGLLVLGIM